LVPTLKKKKLIVSQLLKKYLNYVFFKRKISNDINDMIHANLYYILIFCFLQKIIIDMCQVFDVTHDTDSTTPRDRTMLHGIVLLRGTPGTNMTTKSFAKKIKKIKRKWKNYILIRDIPLMLLILFLVNLIETLFQK